MACSYFLVVQQDGVTVVEQEVRVLFLFCISCDLLSDFLIVARPNPLPLALEPFCGPGHCTFCQVESGYPDFYYGQVDISPVYMTAGTTYTVSYM